MTSHYLYLHHGNDHTQFVVDFDDVWKNVDFSRRDNAKRLLEKHFIEDIDYNKLVTHLGGASFNETIHGGQNKQTILLTVDCFKNFCMLAATPKAKEIRTYYIKMENIMHEYYKNFKSKNNELQNSLQLSQNSLQITETALQQSIKETLIKRHEVLIESNKNKWVVYFCRVQLRDDGSFILKVGETTDIKNRIDVLQCDFGTKLIVLDVFICENSIRFEKSLHNSIELVKYKYSQLEHKNKTLSTEAYHIPNQKEYEKIVKFANNEINKYNNIEFTKLRIKEKNADIIKSLIPNCKNYKEMMNMLEKINILLQLNTDIESKTECEYAASNQEEQVERHTQEHDETETREDECQEDNQDLDVDQDQDVNLEDQEDDTIITSINANATGPIVQIYHKNDLTKVVHVYNSIMEATRDFNYNNKTASFSAIKKAFQHKTLYLDYRWHFIIDRQELNLQKPRNIGETVISIERNTGQIAMLTIDKTKIIKVFKLAKDAAKEILQHPSAMCCAIKHSSPLNNHYWLYWANVEESVQNDFLRSNILPAKQKNIRGIQIKQIHPVTNELVKLFASYTDIQKELQISIRKIKQLIENNEIYKGKYKFVMSK